MHLHILGICGTFMGSLALLARELGHKVTGIDQQVYPPMSTQLMDAGIELIEGYATHGLDTLKPDVVIVGNALSRGNPAVEYMLDHRLHYQSGPQWIAENILRGKTVLAVAGTHGKTTTSSMLAWILEQAGKKPGFLIGGVPANFGISARLGSGEYFVIEADEYDSAFFDKRSKFVHYRPQTLIINNLEFDHADIFPDLAAIQRQFHHLLRTVPASGQVLMPNQQSLVEVVEQGMWSTLEYLSGKQTPWQLVDASDDCSLFSVVRDGGDSLEDNSGQLAWSLCGRHNMHNALAAIAAARHCGVAVEQSCQALSAFQSVKRRMELLGEVNDILVYDDFAHHPTAIKTTLDGARKKYPKKRIVAIVEPRSNTMRMGVHNDSVADAVSGADAVWWCGDESSLFDSLSFDGVSKVHCVRDVDDIVAGVANFVQASDVIIVMSNGGFGGIHQKLMAALDGALTK